MNPFIGPAMQIDADRPSDGVQAGRDGGAGQGSRFLHQGWVDNAIRLTAGGQAVFRLPAGSKKFTAEAGSDWPLSTHESRAPKSVPWAPAKLTVSIVGADGKSEVKWVSQELHKDLPWQPVDINLVDAVAIILNVQQAPSPLPKLDGLWLAPTIHR